MGKSRLDFSEVCERVLKIEPDLIDYVSRAKEANDSYRGIKMHTLRAYAEGTVSEAEAFDCCLPSILTHSLQDWECKGGELQEIVQSNVVSLFTALQMKSGSFTELVALSKAKTTAKSGGAELQNKKRFQHYLTQHDCPSCNSGFFCDETLEWVRENCTIVQSLKSKTALTRLAHIMQANSLDEIENTEFGESTEEKAYENIVAEEILDCLSTLTPREERVIKLRFGLDGEEVQTLSAIGEIYGLSGERIREIQQKAFRKLRHPNWKKKLVVQEFRYSNPYRYYYEHDYEHKFIY